MNSENTILPHTPEFPRTEHYEEIDHFVTFYIFRPEFHCIHGTIINFGHILCQEHG